MTNHKRQKWLCVDGKCIYAIVEVVEKQIPIYPKSSFTIPIAQLQVYCKKKHEYVRNYVISCRDFQNTRLV